MEGLGKWRDEVQLSEFLRVIILGVREERVRMCLSRDPLVTSFRGWAIGPPGRC
jgi:hypothetical protein